MHHRKQKPLQQDLLKENQLMQRRKKLLLLDLQEKSVDVTKKTKTTPTRSSPRKSVHARKKTKYILQDLLQENQLKESLKKYVLILPNILLLL